ncbi:outer membrane beta-barrel protein [Mucilaginibacter myungsuensis]|uniref:Outer membrane beta-barrel protein n=1 Tax=Mucilaginibacter myungsuensis TaxID=649104 RepID=A0A929PYU2_9SPHI|nr:outer membrane beta-barrel protein [Mucilaginibacter myungsuensis]MBE9664519.1 outer membrane beta-barrel protein [Mucilaginibacter myungsuensis]MDN3601336.1 outer membrane beta-barrel protein [Mucilaginibacter myungsuensis]
MKKLIFSLLICLSAVAAKAQIGYNYSQYELGFTAGVNTQHTDFIKKNSTYAFGGQFTYNFTPYINFMAEVNVGALRGDSIITSLPSNFAYNNDYTSVAFRAQLQAGELFDYSRSPFGNALKNFYISGGVGVLYTDLKVYDTGQLSAESKGSSIFIPAKLGYEFKFFNSYNEPFLKLDLGYQLNYIMSDNFDGYTSGKYSDAFTQFSVGLRFAIGGTTSYRKAIHW